MYPKRYYQSPTYKSWAAMLTRIRNPNREDWPLYGGRGIKVCKRWLKFENFLKDMGVRPEGKTLDRRNSNGHYTPKNCRWATASEQMKGRRTGWNTGEKNHWAKFTNVQVQKIRKNWNHTYAYIDKIAKQYVVSFGCICKIVYNETYSLVKQN